MAEPARDVGDELLHRVQRDPASAAAAALTALEAARDERQRVMARWALGMARRELGDLAAARVDLEAAWVAATELDDGSLSARVAVTLALVVSNQGDISGALSILDVSEPTISEEARGHLHLQRGIIHYQQGDFEPALAEYRSAARLFDRTGDELGTIKAQINMGALLSYIGRLGEARQQLGPAAARAGELGEPILAAIAEQNLAYEAALAGDFPAAFDSFERADRRFAEGHYEGPFTRSLRLDHARALLQANLLDEAAVVARRGVAEATETEGGLDLAESLLVLAEVLIAAGDVSGGTAVARASEAEFAGRGRPSWAALAASVALRGEARLSPSSSLAVAIAMNAGELDRCGYHLEAVRAQLLAADLLVGMGDVIGAAALLAPIERSERSSVVHRAAALRIRAAIERVLGHRARARRAVNLGVRLLSEHQAMMGALELRAYAEANSDGLATIGVRMAIEDGRPRELLAQLEATRRVVSLLPSARPPEDAVLTDLLARLRLVAAQEREAAGQGEQSTAVERERIALERQVRWHVRRAPAGEARAALSLGESVRQLGDRALVEYANLDGTLFAVSVIDNRAALHDLGPAQGLLADIDACSHALHRLNREQGSGASRAAAAATFAAITAELAERLVPRRVVRSGRPLVIVPTGVLHALPWGGLPGLTGRAVSVAPSLTGWALAARRDNTVQQVTLIAGPGLVHAEREIEILAGVHDAAASLVGPAATADRVLDAAGRSDLVHLACHGSYRADNPLFSTLRLDDGELNAYDLERCPAMPRTIVLSACNVAMGAPAGGGALLGLATSLMTFGAGSVIAPLTPVSDERVVPVMLRLHRGLREGIDPAHALARASLTDDGRLDPTAAAFVVIGA